MKSDKYIFQCQTKTGKTVSFRYPTINDTQILMDYINKLSAEKTFIFFQGEQQSLEDENKWLEDKLKKIEKYECVFIMAFIDNKLVASSEITLKALAENHIGVFGIAVDIDYRSEGIGKNLMELIIEESVKKIPNMKIINLSVFGDNAIAQNLYKKFGFIEYGNLPQGVRHKENYIDHIYLYKKIN